MVSAEWWSAFDGEDEKTTVLELIRFALGVLPAADVDPAGGRRIEALLAQNLGGGRVELTGGCWIAAQRGQYPSTSRCCAAASLANSANGTTS